MKPSETQLDLFPDQCEIARLTAERDKFCSANFAVNSLKSYEDSWQRFLSWCALTSREPLPATGETVALWATSMLKDGLRVTTVETRLSGVGYRHKKAGYDSPIGPEVRAVLVGARRLRRESPRQKRALTPEQLWKIARVLPVDTPRGLRDRALIVLGFAGAFRRSELRFLDVEDITFVRQGLLVHLRFSKTDQIGVGRSVGIFRGVWEDTCPVRAVRAWLDCRGRQPGPLFVAVIGHGTITNNRLSCDAIALSIKRGVRAIGLNPHLYSGHSLRSGFVTAAAENGANELAIMQRTGHKSVQMVHRYFRPVTAFAVNPLANVL